jgi:hypothetical protein
MSRHSVIGVTWAVICILSSGIVVAGTRVGKHPVGTRQPVPTLLHEVASHSSLAARGATQAIRATDNGVAHVLARHTVGGAQTAGKSVFSAGEDVVGLIRQAESVAPLQQAGGNFQRIVDAGRAIGIDRATGQATSTYTVITDAAGNLITAFPGVP